MRPGLAFVLVVNSTGVATTSSGAKIGVTVNSSVITYPTTLPALANGDIITIEIGANDVANYDAKSFRENFKIVMATLPEGAFVSNMPLFNSRPGSTQNAKHASKIVEEGLKSRPDLIFVDLQKQTEENQSIFGFAPDLFHPNNLSYRNWADAFWAKIKDNNF